MTHNNIKNTITFIGPKDPISFNYYHKTGFLMEGKYRFYSLEHWFTFSRAKVFEQHAIAGQLLFTRDRSILQSLKNKLEKLTKNCLEKKYAVHWSKFRSDYMNEAIICLVKSSPSVQNFLRDHQYDYFAINTPNAFWGMGIDKTKFREWEESGKSILEIYQLATSVDENHKPPKNKMGTLWMDVRDAWFEQGLDKVEIVPEQTRQKPNIEPVKQQSQEINRFKFLKECNDDFDEEEY